MHRHPHILNAATNLLGICFVIIGGLKLTHQSDNTYSDEIAWVAAALLLTSIVLAYMAIRSGESGEWQTRLADWSFLGGVGSIVVSMAFGVVQL